MTKSKLIIPLLLRDLSLYRDPEKIPLDDSKRYLIHVLPDPGYEAKATRGKPNLLDNLEVIT